VTTTDYDAPRPRVAHANDDVLLGAPRRGTTDQPLSVDDTADVRSGMLICRECC